MALLGDPSNYNDPPQALPVTEITDQSFPWSEEAFFRTMSHNPLIGIIVVNSKGTILCTNQAYDKMVGYDPGELIGRHYEVLLPPQDLLKAQGLHNLYLEGRVNSDAFANEWETLAKDGSIKHIFVSHSQMVAPDGEILVISICQDVTDKHQYESLVFAEREKFRRILMDNPSAVILFDERGSYLDIFPGTEHFWVHVRPSEAIGHTVAEILPPEKAEFFLNIISQCIQEKAPIHAEYEMSKGRLKRCYTARVVYLGEENGHARVLWHATDLTRQRELEDSLIEREALLQSLLEASNDAWLLMSEEGEYLEILGSQDHPWVNLNPAKALGRTMDEMLPSKDAKAYMEVIQEVLKKGKAKDFYYTARKGAQEIHYQSRVVPLKPGVVLWQERDISDFVRANLELEKSREMYKNIMNGGMDACFVFRPLRSESGLILDFLLVDLNPAGESITRMKREQLLGKALAEAFPFFRERGYLDRYAKVMETGQPHEEVVNMEDLTKRPLTIFHRVAPLGDGIAVFVREVKKTQEPPPITAEASLPAAEQTESPTKHLSLVQSISKEREALAKQLFGKTILVVDDEPAVLRVCKKALEERGAIPVLAGSKDEALLLIRQTKVPFDVLVFDAILPAHQGPSLFEQGRLLSPTAKLLVISGFSQKIIAERWNVPLDGFLAKPFSPNELGTAILRVLQGPPSEASAE